jgi:transposase
MRGFDQKQPALFSYVSPEQRVPADHPLRPIRLMVDGILTSLSPRFARLYSHTGRPSIPPEKLLRALLLQVLYSVRSERMLLEQLDYNLLFRWFVGLNLDDPIWDATVFSKNRDRLLDGEPPLDQGAGDNAGDISAGKLSPREVRTWSLWIQIRFVARSVFVEKPWSARMAIIVPGILIASSNVGERYSIRCPASSD